jgi:hypothetical protein
MPPTAPSSETYSVIGDIARSGAAFVRHSFDIADTSSSFHTPDSRESNATISIGSDIESFTEETNVRRKRQKKKKKKKKKRKKNKIKKNAHLPPPGPDRVARRSVFFK